jgi:hypothetical protein
MYLWNLSRCKPALIRSIEIPRRIQNVLEVGNNSSEMLSGVRASIRFDLFAYRSVHPNRHGGFAPCQGVYKLTITTAWHDGGDRSHVCPKCERVISSMEGEPGGTCGKQFPQPIFATIWMDMREKANSVRNFQPLSPPRFPSRGRTNEITAGKKADLYTHSNRCCITPYRCKRDGMERNVYRSNIVVCWQRCDRMRVCLKNGLA